MRVRGLGAQPVATLQTHQCGGEGRENTGDLLRRVAHLGLKLRRQALPERRRARCVEADMKPGQTEYCRTGAERQGVAHTLHYLISVLGEAPGLAVPAGGDSERCGDCEKMESAKRPT